MGLVKRQNVWRCDHCGREDVWGAGWCTKLILHKSHGGWDEELVACSDACAKAIDAAKADKVPNALGNRQAAPQRGEGDNDGNT